MPSATPPINQWTRVIVLAAEGAALSEDLKRLFEARDWFAVRQNDPALAMAELCVREKAQASRSAWGLTRMEELALLVLHPERWPGLPRLIEAAARYVPGASVWSAGDDPAVEPLNDRARLIERARSQDGDGIDIEFGERPAHDSVARPARPGDSRLRLPPRPRVPLRAAAAPAAGASAAPALQLAGAGDLSITDSRRRQPASDAAEGCAEGGGPASALCRDTGRLTREEIDMLLAGDNVGDSS